MDLISTEAHLSGVTTESAAFKQLLHLIMFGFFFLIISKTLDSASTFSFERTLRTVAIQFVVDFVFLETCGHLINKS